MITKCTPHTTSKKLKYLLSFYCHHWNNLCEEEKEWVEGKRKKRERQGKTIGLIRNFF